MTQTLDRQSDEKEITLTQSSINMRRESNTLTVHPFIHPSSLLFKENICHSCEIYHIIVVIKYVLIY